MPSYKRPLVYSSRLVVALFLIISVPRLLSKAYLKNFSASFDRSVFDLAVAPNAATASAMVEASKDSLYSTSSSHMVPMPIDELVQSYSAANVSCPEGATPLPDTPASSGGGSSGGSSWRERRKIPRIIHITSKSRCATPEVHSLVSMWRSWDNYSLYFHDDDAVQRLFSHPYTRATFPQLNETLKCVTNGATKADLWRYVALYIYGGVYTDIDNKPVGINALSIGDDDDAFFTIEGLGILSQYFFASSPRHPLMKEALLHGIRNLRGIANVMRNNPARSTGPGAIKNGFITFMNGTTNGYISAGVYVGMNARSITAVGDKRNASAYINRNGLDGRAKSAYYKALGIEHFHENSIYPRQGRISCMEHLKRTNGTSKVAKYRFDEKAGQYVDEVA
mmetsp:Transcript_11882/g.25716  ORF Transcript_11882/g.25716 Transcript_11882/m.25716 type:complete len:394 (+) Transcript_11882:213-1394(+)